RKVRLPRGWVSRFIQRVNQQQKRRVGCLRGRAHCVENHICADLTESKLLRNVGPDPAPAEPGAQQHYCGSAGGDRAIRDVAKEMCLPLTCCAGDEQGRTLGCECSRRVKEAAEASQRGAEPSDVVTQVVVPALAFIPLRLRQTRREVRICA